MTGRRVLVIEDHADARAGIASLLRAHDYPALEAENGKDALELLLHTAERPGLTVLDLMMPGTPD